MTETSIGAVTRSPDHRFVYANSFNVQFNGADLVLGLGVLNDLGDPKAGAEVQVSVAMTATGMKALAVTLMTIVKHFEKSSGNIIPVSPETQALLDKADRDRRQ